MSSDGDSLPSWITITKVSSPTNAHNLAFDKADDDANNSVARYTFIIQFFDNNSSVKSVLKQDTVTVFVLDNFVYPTEVPSGADADSN